MSYCSIMIILINKDGTFVCIYHLILTDKCNWSIDANEELYPAIEVYWYKRIVQSWTFTFQ